MGLFVIVLGAITGSYSAKVLSHCFNQPCQHPEIAHAYNIPEGDDVEEQCEIEKGLKD